MDVAKDAMPAPEQDKDKRKPNEGEPGSVRNQGKRTQEEIVAETGDAEVRDKIDWRCFVKQKDDHKSEVEEPEGDYKSEFGYGDADVTDQ